MVTGPLRAVLWFLGALAVIWLVAGVAMLPAMGRMMEGGMMSEGMMGDGMMMEMGGMMSMMAAMAAQFLAMIGLLGVFLYLVVDSVRRRRA